MTTDWTAVNNRNDQATRVVIFEDDDEDRVWIEEVVSHAPTQLSHLGPIKIECIGESSGVDAFLDRVRAEKQCPCEVILADVFMPEKPGGEPTARGGACRIYFELSRLARAGRLDARKFVFLAITGVREDADPVIREIARDQKLYFDDCRWANRRIKPSARDGIRSASWIAFIRRAIALYNNHDWRQRQFCIDDEVLVRSRRYEALFGEADDFAAQHHLSVVGISGTAGGGTEQIARRIHRQRFAEGSPFIQRSLRGIAEDEFETDLLGTKGDVARANGGTLFLGNFEAIWELPERYATRIWRLLEPDHRYQVRGEDQPRRFEGLIVVTGPDLTSELRRRPEMKSPIFGPLEIPDLPPIDVLPFAEFFLQECLRAAAASDVKLDERSFAPDAVAELERFPWSRMGHLGALEEVVRDLAHMQSARGPISRQMVVDVIERKFQPSSAPAPPATQAIAGREEQRRKSPTQGRPRGIGRAATDVRADLLLMRDNGRCFTNYENLARELQCVRSTIGKAINGGGSLSPSDTLKGWVARAKGAPRATGLTQMISDSARQTREAASDGLLVGDEFAAAWAKLLEKTPPAEHARLNAMDERDRQELATLNAEQDKANEPSPLEADNPGERPRTVKEHKRL